VVKWTTTICSTAPFGSDRTERTHAKVSSGVHSKKWISNQKQGGRRQGICSIFAGGYSTNKYICIYIHIASHMCRGAAASQTALTIATSDCFVLLAAPFVGFLCYSPLILGQSHLLRWRWRERERECDKQWNRKRIAIEPQLSNGLPWVSPDSEPSIEHGAIPTGTCSKASSLVVELPDPSACYLDLPRWTERVGPNTFKH
jgi:hypothetical protein